MGDGAKTKKCSSCDRECSAKAKFCAGCGAKFAADGNMEPDGGALRSAVKAGIKEYFEERKQSRTAVGNTGFTWTVLPKRTVLLSTPLATRMSTPCSEIWAMCRPYSCNSICGWVGFRCLARATWLRILLSW